MNVKTEFKTDLNSLQNLKRELQRMNYTVNYESDFLQIKPGRVAGFGLNGWASLLAGDTSVELANKALVLKVNVSNFMGVAAVGAGCIVAATLIPKASEEIHLGTILGFLGLSLIAAAIVASLTIASTIKRDLLEAEKAATE